MASTWSRLFSKWREVKVESEFCGWHTAHCFNILQGERRKILQEASRNKKHSTLSSGSNWRISPDVVVVQPQHLQVLEQADALRDLGQTVPVQQEL